MLKNPHDNFTPIKGSACMAGSRYNSIDHIMSVKFHNGAVYHVHGVEPGAYQDFLDAPSQGEHYHTFIKGSYHIERGK